MDPVYEPPALVEIGAFAEVTMGKLPWGYDEISLCWFSGCWE